MVYRINGILNSQIVIVVRVWFVTNCYNGIHIWGNPYGFLQASSTAETDQRRVSGALVPWRQRLVAQSEGNPTWMCTSGVKPSGILVAVAKVGELTLITMASCNQLRRDVHPSIWFWLGSRVSGEMIYQKVIAK